MKAQDNEKDQAVELSVVIPCLNEAETIGMCVKKAAFWLKAHEVSGEVVVADNSSSDGSADIAARAGARVITVKARGYGSALQKGIQAARGRYVVMGDGDNSYDFSSLEPFLNKLRQGFDLVMGNRFAGGIRPGAMPFLHRYLGNPLLSWLGRVFYKSPVRDFHCGLRGFSRQAVLRLNLHSPGMEFASEMVVKATLMGYRIAEVPTTLDPDGRSGKPHLRTWRDGFRHLQFLLLHSPRWIFLYPGILLCGLGAVTVCRLFFGAVKVAGIEFDIHTMFFGGIFFILGFQLVLFDLLARTLNPLLSTPGEALITRLLRRLFRGNNALWAALAAGSGGVALSAFALLQWGRADFGGLDPVHTMRLVIPGGVLLALGLQIFFFGFMHAMLGLKEQLKQ